MTIRKNIPGAKLKLLLKGFGLVLLIMISSNSLNASDSIRDWRWGETKRYYSYWKGKYLIPSSRFPGDYKVDFDGKGETVSEAIGYGMLITVLMADADPDAKAFFDGLDRFRRRFPSRINAAFMCWKIPPKEHPASNDCATDGELDIAFSLLLAHQRWNSPSYLEEAKSLIRNIGDSLVRPDCSLRLGDWDSEPGETRCSDFMPTHFRAFRAASGDPLWEKVESRCYAILEELQQRHAPSTGLIPDFAIEKNGFWVPAKPGFLESSHDGDYYYNACRVPWRLGWAVLTCNDERPRRILTRFMNWAVARVGEPDKFAAGYRLDGKSVRNSDFDTACFISPTGVAAMALGDQAWENTVFDYAMKSREEYYEDTVNLLSMIVMSGREPMPAYQQKK